MALWYWDIEGFEHVKIPSMYCLPIPFKLFPAFRREILGNEQYA